MLNSLSSDNLRNTIEDNFYGSLDFFKGGEKENGKIHAVFQTPSLAFIKFTPDSFSVPIFFPWICLILFSEVSPKLRHKGFLSLLESADLKI